MFRNLTFSDARASISNIKKSNSRFDLNRCVLRLSASTPPAAGRCRQRCPDETGGTFAGRRDDGRQPLGEIGMYRYVDPLTDAPPDPYTPPEARARVAALYQAHALGLVKLAKIMLGDQAAAEDIVQDAFLGLYRKWPALEDQDRALAYLRASVLNGCRAAHRGRTRRDRALRLVPTAEDMVSAEESALIGEANREVMAALRALPARQREAVMLASGATCRPSP